MITAPARPRVRPLSLLAAFLLTLAGLVAVGTQPAQAAPSNVQMPFPCGETWYASTYSGHSPSVNSIDWNLSGAQDHNKPVLAGASGTATVQPYQYPGYGNYVDVNVGGGWVLRYAHLETVNVTTGQSVAAQTQIGTVGSSGLTDTTAYHLHYEQRYFNGTSWSVQPATFNGSAISYAYSLPGNAYTSGNCATPSWGGVGTGVFFGSDTLMSGQQLGLNQYLLSSDARFALLLQTDGNLVLYSGSSIWHTNTAGSGATRLAMQTDGNLVLYNVNTPIWWSGAGGGQAHLTLQADGNLVTYNETSGTPTWWTGTGGHAATTYVGSDRLMGGQQLTSQQYLRSLDKRYALLLQSDGNLVLYGPGYHVLWNSVTSTGTRLVMQPDGNLVLYNVNTALWYTSTGGTGTNRLVMQNDGNLVTYTLGDAPTWWSSTGGQL